MKILVSDVEQNHADTCKSKIEEECPTASVTTRIESLSASVTWALANRVDIISRSTTGLSDSRNENEGDTAWEGAEVEGEFSDEFSWEFDRSGTFRVGIVHALGSNSHILDTDPSRLDVISACSAGDGAGNCDASYGAGLEFFSDEETTQSYSTARIAGIIGQIMLDNPSWNFHDARQALRQTASFYSTGWVADGGYGAIDKTAAKALTTSQLKTFSPTRPAYTQDGAEIVFSWVANWQIKASNPVMARFDSSPSYDDIPAAKNIIFDAAGSQFIYNHTSEIGTFYFIFMTRDDDGNYSKIDTFDIYALTFTSTGMVTSFVYHINSDKWSKFANLDILKVKNLIEGTTIVNLVLDSNKLLMKYPADDNIDDNIQIKSKKFYIDNSKMRKVLMNFTGTPSVTVRVWNDKFSTSYRDYDIAFITTSEWKAIVGGYIGDYVEFIVDDFTTFESIMFEISGRE